MSDYSLVLTYVILCLVIVVTINLAIKLYYTKKTLKNRVIFNDKANTMIRRDEILNDKNVAKIDDYNYATFEPNDYHTTKNFEEIIEEDNSLINTIYDSIEDYQNEFFNFRNKVFNTSHTFDNIDNMNQRIMAENRGENGNNGKTIKDVYDSLFDKNILDQNIDEITQLPQYKLETHNGTCFTDDHWLYENDDVNNGGKFMDNVTGANIVDGKYCL
jgi:hypothetical protein